MLLDRRVDIGKRADGAGDGARRHLPPGLFKPVLAPIHLGVEAREGQAHGRRLGMDAVAAADADRVLMLKGAFLQRGEDLVHIGQKDVGGADKLDVQRGVQNVRGGHALMDKARVLGADMFGQMRQEGDDIMLGDRLDLVDARHIEFHVLRAPHRLGIRLRDHAKGGLGVAGMGLDLIPDAELRLGRPDRNHLGAGIAGDHGGPLACDGVAGLLECAPPGSKDNRPEMRLMIADFEGRWQVRRMIDDHLAGQSGEFTGTAMLSPRGNGLWDWSESGVIALGGGKPMSAARRYLWRAEGDRIAVLFDDGRPFHDFAPVGAPEAAHWCAPDDYRVRYDFSRWPDWQVEWVVKGPRKDYRMFSHHARAAKDHAS